MSAAAPDRRGADAGAAPSPTGRPTDQPTDQPTDRPTDQRAGHERAGDPRRPVPGPASTPNRPDRTGERSGDGCRTAGGEGAGPGATGPFRSILFADRDAPRGTDDTPQPGCFADLHLDRVVASVIAAREQYRLLGYFHLPPDDLDLVNYRQDVFRDLERQPVHEAVTRFARGLQTMRARAERCARSGHHLEKQRWFLDAARAYCDTVEAVTSELARADPRSRGLCDVCAHLTRYRESPAFTRLRDDAAAVAEGLEAVRYDVWIHGSAVTVGPFDDEPDHGAAVAATFERFRQRDIRVRPPDRRRRRTPFDQTITTGTGGQGMDHVEMQILDRVAIVFPERFAALDAFCRSHADHVDPTIAVFDREIQFYLAYLDHIAPLRRAGLDVEYPRLSAEDKTENAAGTFDLALAAQLLHDDACPVVGNDIHLDGRERVLVVTGPNNGGKTTLARTVGQLHYLAALGCPVPGREVRLFLVDAVYTHFEREENIATLAGKLQEELDRMHDDLERATARSLLIMNEMFGATTARDALFLSREMLARIGELDALGVCVTFLDELAGFDDTSVSMVSTVDPDDPARRPFTVVRAPADGRAYARALAEKYGLTYDTLTERLSS